MPILNYTTEIDAAKSISEIQACLVEHGANAVLNEYDGGYIVAVSFKIRVDEQDFSFRLPSDWRPVMAVLKSQSEVFRGTGLKRRRALSPSLVTQEQALRVSWRILKDWVEAQMALVEIKMVKTEQVFLPYIITRDNQTLYEKFKQSPQLLLGNG